MPQTSSTGTSSVGQPLVDRGDQRRAAVALGQRDVALEGERADARPVVRERRAVGVHHHRVGVAAWPSRRGSTRRTGCRRARGSRRAPRCGTRAGRAAGSSAAPRPRCSSGPRARKRSLRSSIAPEPDRPAPVVGDQRDVAQVERVDQRERVVDVAPAACRPTAAAACPSARSPCGRTPRSGARAR